MKGRDEKLINFSQVFKLILIILIKYHFLKFGCQNMWGQILIKDHEDLVT